MGYVVAAYLVVAAAFAAYVLTLAARQRMIADLADAAGDAGPRAAAAHPRVDRRR